MATHHGSLPTPISATLVFSSSLTLNTDTESLSGLTLQTKSSSWVTAIGLERVASGVCFFPSAAADWLSHSAAPSRSGTPRTIGATARTTSLRVLTLASLHVLRSALAVLAWLGGTG